MRVRVFATVGVLACLASAAANGQAAPTAPAARSLLGADLPSTDLDRSTAFYVKGLGLEAGPRLETGQSIEAPLIFPGGGAVLLLVRPKALDVAKPVQQPPRRVILTVPDLKGLPSRLAAAGYPLESAPLEQPLRHVVVAVVEDPDGNQLELVQRGP